MLCACGACGHPVNATSVRNAHQAQMDHERHMAQQELEACVDTGDVSTAYLSPHSSPVRWLPAGVIQRRKTQGMADGGN